MATTYASYKVENSLRQKGRALIAGMDEVGRGALAGPLVMVVVVLPKGCRLKLKDSKLLAPAERAKLAEQIIFECLDFGVGQVSANEIDARGLGLALKLAAERALENLDIYISRLIIDGKQNFFDDDFVICQVKADRDVACVAAASILAKVYRDELMRGAASQHGEYMFDSHFGYGTKRHFDAIKTYGKTPLHRKSFRLKGYRA